LSIALWVTASIVAAFTLHAGVNAALLCRPPARPPRTERSIAVLLPLRDEAARVGPCLHALLEQRDVPSLEIVVLDDGSTDGTADLVGSIAGDRVRLITGAPLPPGWLGKPHACAQLAASTTAEILVFVDADVVLAPNAVAAGVALLNGANGGVDLVSPYPTIVGQDLVQPLLQWSWLTFLPLRAIRCSSRESLAAAGGQFLVVRAAAYAAAGGHGAVRDRVLEDIGLARAIKRSGGRITLADGSTLATCRMYRSWRELTNGYAKSLWASFGSPVGAAAVVTLLIALYVLPFAAMLTGSMAGLVGYLLAVAGRAVTARAAGGRWFPAAFTHPISIVIFSWLVVVSFTRRRRGRLRWKGRAVEVEPSGRSGTET
jgi:hypothetical protein